MTISDFFPATVQGLDEGEHPAENTIPTHCRHEDKFRGFVRTWGTHQIAHWYECYVLMEPSAQSNREPFTQFLRDQRCVACHEHRVLGYWIAACHSPEERIQKQLVTVIWKTSHPCCRPAAQLVFRHFHGDSRKRRNTTGSDTSLKAPWKNGKTERAGKDWKEDYYKMTQDGPDAQTWTDFEEDCDAVNQARAPKNNHSGYSAYQRVFGKYPPQMEDAVLECGGADLGVVRWQQTGELAQERSMTMRRIALQASLALDHKRRWKRALHHAAKHYKGELHVGQPLWFWRRGANAAKRPTSAFWHPSVVISNTLATVWIAYRGSAVNCARPGATVSRR